MRKLLFLLLAILLLSCEKPPVGDYEVYLAYLGGDKETIIIRHCTEPRLYYGSYGKVFLRWDQLTEDHSRPITEYTTLPLSNYKIKCLKQYEDNN